MFSFIKEYSSDIVAVFWILFASFIFIISAQGEYNDIMDSINFSKIVYIPTDCSTIFHNQETSTGLSLTKFYSNSESLNYVSFSWFISNIQKHPVALAQGK